MNLNLKNKVAIVTGGAKGIGFACCNSLVEEGARVVCVDVDRTALDEICRQDIESSGVAGIFADVSDAKSCENAVRRVVDGFGGVDILINNVGIEPKDSFTPIHDSTLEVWNHVLEVNLTSHFLMMKYCIPEMMARGGGTIINIASVQAFQSEENGAPAYGASKGALLPLTRIAALHYAKHGIRVLAVCPGAIDTPLVRAELDDEGIKKLGRLHPLGRVGIAAEVADVICFLAGSKASFMTGTAVYVDGGLTAKGAWDRENF